MGSHSYLVNLETNIHDLRTSGLLNSHASATTTTNVGHMAGDRTSVISLGELQELGYQRMVDMGGRSGVIDVEHPRFNEVAGNVWLSNLDRKLAYTKATIDQNAQISPKTKSILDNAIQYALDNEHQWVNSHRIA